MKIINWKTRNWMDFLIRGEKKDEVPTSGFRPDKIHYIKMNELSDEEREEHQGRPDILSEVN